MMHCTLLPTHASCIDDIADLVKMVVLAALFQQLSNVSFKQTRQ